MSSSVVVVIAACFLQLPGQGSTAPATSGQHLVDMSHPFDDTTVYWPGMPSFVLEVMFEGVTEDGYWFGADKFDAPEHGGTHIDPPSHFSENGWKVDEIPLERLVAPAVVVDISARALDDPDALLTKDDLLNWEEDHGKIPEGAVVFMNSGWDQYWPNKTAIFGNAEGDTTDLHFPGFDPTAVQWLAGEREVVGLGVDTPSIDNGPNTMFDSHVLMTKNNIYGLENVNNLGKLPSSGATVHVLPMKIGGGNGAPVRIMASWGGEPCGGSTIGLSVSQLALVMAIFTALAC